MTGTSSVQFAAAPFFRASGGFLLVLLAILALRAAASAQSLQLGVQLTGVHLHKLHESPLGIGGRFHYNITPLIAPDLEFTYYPENPSGNFGQTAVLFGVRAGRQFDRIGFFLKGRPGLMHFAGEYFDLRLDQTTFFIVDIGGVVEYYPTPRTFLRIDAGDTVIYFGSARLINRLNPDPLGTVHNFQPGFGFGFRF
jgi:hypothetical protein